MPKVIILGAGLLTAFAMTAGSALAQEECANRGTLDVMYCDADGDLVADAPTDPSKLVDPDTLVFAYTPVEDPAIYEDIWTPFIEHLEEVTGKDVQFFAVQSNSAEVEAMRSGRLHIAGFSTGPTPFAVNLAGVEPFAIMGAEDGQFGYKLQVYTQADSDIKEMIYSGSHDQSMLGVVAGDYDAAPVASEVVDRMAERGLYDPADVRIVWESDPFPTTSYGVAYNLAPELKEKIKEAFGQWCRVYAPRPCC